MGGYFSFSTRSDFYFQIQVWRSIRYAYAPNKYVLRATVSIPCPITGNGCRESLLKCCQSTSPLKQSLYFQICIWTLLCVVTSSQWETTIYIQQRFLPITTLRSLITYFETRFDLRGLMYIPKLNRLQCYNLNQ